MTCSARFCTDRLGASATALPPVSSTPPQKDNIPLRGHRRKAIAKMTLLWKSCEQLPLLSAEHRAQKNVFVFLKRTMTISELRVLRDVDVFQGMCNLQRLLSSVVNNTAPRGTNTAPEHVQTSPKTWQTHERNTRCVDFFDWTLDCALDQRMIECVLRNYACATVRKTQ